MKRTLFTAAFALAAVVAQAQTPTLQEVTTAGNKTTSRVVLGATDDGITKLQVEGGITINSGLRNTSSRPPITNGTGTEIRARSLDGYYLDDGFLRLSAGGGTNAWTKTYIEISGYSTVPDMDRNIVMGTNGAERFRITNVGNVGIGTANPKAKLAVNGDILAKKVKVTVAATDWPDYVFAPGYQMPSLPQLEQYVHQHSHLPGIPAAAEVEQQGLDLGQSQSRLLQKIEELTLYLIDQHKQLAAQQQLIADQQQQLAEQDRRLKELEGKVKR